MTFPILNMSLSLRLILALQMATLLALVSAFGSSSYAHGDFSSPRGILAPAVELQKRELAVGSSCSAEGQWNCMTRSWQRCASGQWSAVINCAAGTICTPSGQTMEFRVDYDGTVGAPARSIASRMIRGEALQRRAAVCAWGSFWAIVMTY